MMRSLWTAATGMQAQNPFDMAIEGPGFFQILQINGETAYTRAGTLKLTVREESLLGTDF